MEKVLFINGSPRKNGHTVETLKLVEGRLNADTTTRALKSSKN